MASTGKKLQTYDIFVGNLPLDATEKNVGKIFSKFGEIQGLIVRDANTNPKKRYAFVNYLCEPDAERACVEINGQEYEGSKIVVRRQEYRKKGGGGGGGGGKKDGDKRSNQKKMETDNSILRSSSSQSSLSQSDREIMMVTYVESPVTVWLQEMTEENAEKLHNITEQIASVCPAAPKVQGQAQMNKTYAAQFTEDGLWYRCCVKQLFGTDTMKVQYIDYGNTEEISIGSLVEIPQALSSIKPLATKIVLHNAKARDLSDQNGIRYMKRVTDGKVVECVKSKMLTDSSGFYAQLYVDGECLNEMVIAEGFASKRPDMGPRAGGDNQSRGGMMNNPFNSGTDNMSHFNRSAPVRKVEQNNWGISQNSRDFNVGNINSGYFNSESGYNNYLPPPVNMFNPMMRQGGNTFNVGRQITGDQGGQIQIKLQRNEENARNFSEVEQNLKSNLAKRKKEVDMLRTEVAKKDLELQQATLSKVQIHSVTELAKKVRSVRQQFPSGKVSDLEKAIEVAFSPQKVTNSSVTSLQPVVTALSTYRAVQKEICETKDMTELETFTVKRDESKRDLHEKLQSCVSELSNMPLNVRYQEVKDTEDRVRKNYSSFQHAHKQGSPSLDEIVTGFKMWKRKKDEEFQCVRGNTDACHDQVEKLLQRLSSALILDEEPVEDTSNFDMDGVLKTYSNALHQELGVTDVESSGDVSLVSTVLSALLNELKSELNIIVSFQQFATEFSQLKEGIEPWLDKKPSVDDILEKKKALRGLKSKLRHKEADRQDLEESGDCSEDDLNVVKSEISFLKQQIHQLLLSHDQLVVELAKVSDEYFPELLIKYQDMGLQTFLKYNGLVKDGWDIDYYTLTPALKLGMSHSEFCDKSVFLQEYHLGDADHLTKEEFLAQVMAFKEISQKSENILTVDAVFFQKNDRIAYMQTEHADVELLEDYLVNHNISDKKRQAIAISVTSALHHLHEHGFVHGDVNPLHVAVKPDGSAVLLTPDFSKALFERTRKGYMSENGLLFQAPEVLNTHQSSPVQITTRTDLYNLGLLILFLHHPKSMIVLNRDGTPNLSVMSLDSDVGAFLYNLLCYSPEPRLQAANALRSGYLSREIPEIEVQVSPPIAEPRPGADHGTSELEGVHGDVNTAPMTSPPVQEVVSTEPSDIMSQDINSVNDQPTLMPDQASSLALQSNGPPENDQFQFSAYCEMLTEMNNQTLMSSNEDQSTSAEKMLAASMVTDLLCTGGGQETLTSNMSNDLGCINSSQEQNDMSINSLLVNQNVMSGDSEVAEVAVNNVMVSSNDLDGVDPKERNEDVSLQADDSATNAEKNVSAAVCSQPIKDRYSPLRHLLEVQGAAAKKT